MKPFRRRRRGGIVATFDHAEAELLTSLCAQVIELLRDRNGESESSPDPLAAMVGLGGPVLPPEDPVLARLLPDGYSDDEENSAEFRRFTEQSLTSAKVDNAQTIINTLTGAGMVPGGDSTVEVELDIETAWSWLRALTDLRLAIAVRLGLESDEDIDVIIEREDEQSLAMIEVYDWLTYVQDSLVGAAS